MVILPKRVCDSPRKKPLSNFFAFNLRLQPKVSSDLSNKVKNEVHWWNKIMNFNFFIKSGDQYMLKEKRVLAFKKIPRKQH